VRPFTLHCRRPAKAVAMDDLKRIPQVEDDPGISN
jgi:hypothetical protein